MSLEKVVVSDTRVLAIQEPVTRQDLKKVFGKDTVIAEIVDLYEKFMVQAGEPFPLYSLSSSTMSARAKRSTLRWLLVAGIICLVVYGGLISTFLLTGARNPWGPLLFIPMTVFVALAPLLPPAIEESKIALTEKYFSYNNSRIIPPVMVSRLQEWLMVQYDVELNDAQVYELLVDNVTQYEGEHYCLRTGGNDGAVEWIEALTVAPKKVQENYDKKYEVLREFGTLAS